MKTMPTSRGRQGAPEMPVAPQRQSWASDLARPAPLLAVAVLVANDHVFKPTQILPGWITGKLSDFAGLFFFPILIVGLAELLARLAGTSLRHRRACN